MTSSSMKKNVLGFALGIKNVISRGDFISHLLVSIAIIQFSHCIQTGNQ